MAANLTPLFQSTVKALKKTGFDGDHQPQASTNKIDNLDFRDISHNLLQTIVNLRKFINEKHADYLTISSGYNATSESQRQKIDSEVEETLMLCQKGMRRIRVEHIGSQLPEQVRQHRQAVLELLQKYIHRVTDIYKEQVTVRRKQVSIQKQICGHSLENGIVRKRLVKSPKSKQLLLDTSSENKQNTTRAVDTEMFNDEEQQNPDNSTGFTADDLQMFAEENETLFDELNSMTNEVKNLESKVTEIAHLQDMFTENVLKQEKEIEHIGQIAVNTTENVRSGNEQLREAMRNQSTMRFWVLFCVIVCTLTLFFLDWYNA